MRIRREVALLLCVCMWIPVAQSFDATADDLEASGDDNDLSGSGSGDLEVDDASIMVKTTRAPLNATSSTTDDSVVYLAHTVTQPLSTAPPDVAPLTPHFDNQAPLHTTSIPKTTSTSTSIMVFPGSFDETTAVQHEAETTTAPAVDPPAGPVSVGSRTTAHTEDITEETTVSVFKEEKAMVPKEGTEKTSETVEMETTPVPTDLDASGDNVETMTSTAFVGNEVEKELFPRKSNDVNTERREEDLDFEFEDLHNEIGPKTRAKLPDANVPLESSSDESLLDKKEVLAGVIAGGVVGLAFAVMLVALMVYRMKKKDEGSYALDEHKHPNGYQKPQRQEEFLA